MSQGIFEMPAGAVEMRIGDRNILPEQISEPFVDFLSRSLHRQIHSIHRRIHDIITQIAGELDGTLGLPYIMINCGNIIITDL
jgi:hypothetical protein